MVSAPVFSTVKATNNASAARAYSTVRTKGNGHASAILSSHAMRMVMRSASCLTRSKDAALTNPCIGAGRTLPAGSLQNPIFPSRKVRAMRGKRSGLPPRILVGADQSALSGQCNTGRPRTDQRMRRAPTDGANSASADSLRRVRTGGASTLSPSLFRLRGHPGTAEPLGKVGADDQHLGREIHPEK